MLDQIMLGLIGIVVGVVFVIFARKFIEWFGPMGIAEEKLGGGGSYTALRLIGIFIATTSFLYMTGFLETAVRGIVRALGF